MLSELLGLTDSSREVLTAVVLSSAAKLAGLYLVAHTHRAKFEKVSHRNLQWPFGLLSRSGNDQYYFFLYLFANSMKIMILKAI